MKKNRLLIIPFLLGLILIFLSWYLSYPLLVNSVEDSVFNHVSILYWIGLSLLLPSLSLIGVTIENKSLKMLIAFGIVVTIYSTSYFHNMLPGSDQQFYRGMTEYFIETENLDPLQPNHNYYQWPSFYILSYVTTSICGLSLGSFEFLLYTVIGFLLAVSIYSYASRAYKKGSLLAVPVFFISMYIFLNYQCGPFALAVSLLFVFFMLETQEKNIGLIIIGIILFIDIVVTHLFVPLFLIIYLMARNILHKNKQYTNLLLFALTFFFVYQITLAQYSFSTYISYFLTAPSEYSNIFQATFAVASHPIDAIAQTFSRLVTITFVAISGVCFIFLLVKRKLRSLDVAILLAGITYAGAGIIFAALGARAVPLAFIPISLGVAWLFGRRVNSYLKHIITVFLIVLLALFPFIPIHQSFNDIILFQTQEEYQAENFFAEFSNWEETNYILAYTYARIYITTKLDLDVNFKFDIPENREPDIIFYTVGLGKSLLRQNYSIANISYKERLNVAYDNGFSYIATKAHD